MENKTIVGWIAGLALIVAVVGLFTPGLKMKSYSNDLAGAAGNMLIENYDPYWAYNDGLKSENSIVLSGADGDITTGDDLTVTDDATITDDFTVSGGVFTLTTSNSATSTAIMGCVQTYATSTATAWRLGIGSIATSSPLYSGGTGTNFVLAQYGTCPF